LRIISRIGAFEHRFDGSERGVVERQHPLAPLVLAPADVEGLRVEVDVLSPQVLDLDAAHGRIGGEHGRAVDVPPFRVALGHPE
jgi:hypothetical protein